MTDPSILLLQRVLAVVNHDWVYEFLFPQTAQSDLLHTALRNAFSNPHPCTGEMRIKTLFPTPLSPCHSLDETMHILFVPSFSNGPITVGFQIYERIRTNTISTRRLFLSRTVRDDDSGLLFSVSFHETYGLTEINFGQQFSGSFRNHAFMVMQSGMFMDAIEEMRHGSFNHRLFQRALVFGFFSSEQKPCHKCNNIALNQTCLCPVQVRRRAHPMDFRSDYDNMLTYCGSFSGTCSVGVYWNGVNTFRSQVPSSCVATIRKNNSVFTKLSQWGMSSHTDGLVMSLTRMQVPHLIQAAIFGGTHDGAGMELSDWILGKTNVETGGTLSEGSAIDAEVSDVHEGGILEHCHDMFGVLPETNKIEVFGATTNAMDLIIDTCLNDTLFSGLEVEAVHDSPFSIEDHSNNDTISTPEGGTLVSASQATPRENPMSSSAALILPAGQVENQLDVMDEEARKAEVRKLRNRAAAHRSNAKKKAMVEKMKRDLGDAKEREKLLRKRQKALLQENIQLRALHGNDKNSVETVR